MALLVLHGERDGGTHKVFPTSILSEAAAIPCQGSSGSVTISGLAEQATFARTAVLGALHYIKLNLPMLEGLMGKKPRIDLLRCIRLREDGSEMEGSYVDIVLHVPPHYSAAFLAPSMVIAIMVMLWRLPPLRGWSVVGTFDTAGRLTGYPRLDHLYLSEARHLGLHTLVVPQMNARTLKKNAKKRHMDLKALGLKVYGCKDMVDVVKLMLLGEKPQAV